jgi:PQQ-like domain
MRTNGNVRSEHDKTLLPRTRWIKTRITVSSLVALIAFGVSTTFPVSSTNATANTLQMSSDNSETGWYPNEPQLAPSVVAGGDFGELFDTQLTGEIYAQPLISQPTVLTVTEADNAYGLNSTTGAIEWQDNFGPAADPLAQISCGDIGPQMGITGTPVIDSATDIAYFVAATSDGTDGTTKDYMEAVNVQTGLKPSNWPTGGVLMQGSADGDPGTIFNAQWQTQRPGLVLVDGVVYAAFGASCDDGNWEGWLIGVSASTAKITTMWSTEEDVPDTGFEQPGAGIWQSGSAPIVNSQGDIFVATGNGDDPSNPEPGTDSSVTTFGEAVVELSTASGILHPIDFFIASDADSLNTQDGDLGSGGPIALPASMGTAQEPNVLLEVGKQGILYALNMNHLGGYQHGPHGSDAVPSEVGPFGGVWSRPTVWPGNGGYIYYPTAGSGSFSASGGTLNVLQREVSASGAVYFNPVGTTSTNAYSMFAYGSGIPIVTSNGTNSGSALVWIIRNPYVTGTEAELQAYNPIPENPGPNGTLQEVWSAPISSPVTFNEPAVNNGIVYVSTEAGTLLAFGLLASASPALAGDNVNFAPSIVSQSNTATATFTALATTTVSSFTETGTAFTYGTPDQTLPATLSSGQTITVPITFTPDVLGDNTGTLTANVSSGTATVSLDGQGLASTATLTASPDAANFRPQLIGGAKISQKVTFTNVSGSPLDITGFSTPALPFAVPNPPADGALGAGDSVSITVDFSPPGSSGDFDHVFGGVATLETSSGDFGVPVSGSADPPAQITTVPNTLNFGNVPVGSSAVLHFDVGDQGGEPLTIIRSTPPVTNGFTALTRLVRRTVIAPNTSVRETVRFTPTSNRPVSATWQIEGNDGNGVQTVKFTGEVSYALTNFVTVAFGSENATLSSGAMRALKAFAKTLAGGDSVSCTGYAEHNAPLAKDRAIAVADYLTGLVQVHLTLRSVTNVAANKVTVAAPRGQ